MSAPKPLPGAVLFVCTLNAIRSPMAEGLMKKSFAQHVYVQSCGLEAGEVNDLMVAVMGEKGIDMSGHQSKSLADIGAFSFDIVIAFNLEVEAVVKTVFADTDTEIILWETPDPTQGAMDVRAMMENFRAVRDNIAMRIRQKFG